MKKQFFFFLLFFLPTVYGVWAQKNISTFLLEAPQLQTTKKIWLYLPENYTQTTKKYPVLYLHDAQNLFDATTSYAGEWQIDETLDSLKAEVIIVGIEHGNEKRIDELTPYKNEKYGGGKGTQFSTQTLYRYTFPNKNRSLSHRYWRKLAGRITLLLCNIEIS
jgi:alpha-glucosidase